MKGIAGYVRYDRDPEMVGCPRARTDMTPCIARDGSLALAGGTCVGCDNAPRPLLDELRKARGKARSTGTTRLADTADADLLRDLVRRDTAALLAPKEKQP